MSKSYDAYVAIQSEQRSENADDQSHAWVNRYVFRKDFCTASCDSPRFQIPHMIYFVQNVQRYRRYKKFEIYVEISTGTTISQEMLKQTVNKNNIHVPVGVSQVSQLVVMILLINDCYVMSLVVIISRMNFVLYRNNFCIRIQDICRVFSVCNWIFGCLYFKVSTSNGHF